jgi:amidase
MDAAELICAGIARQAELVRAGEISPPELVGACLDRIAARDPELNAFRIVRAEQSLAEAAAAERELAAGGGEGRPLLGVPIAIKDDTDLAGEVTAVGTRAHGPPAEEDAVIVERLRAAGAIPIGKTNVPELIIWPFTESATWGVTRNPWSPERVPGGSSGGAATAVAAGMVGGALGSDGAGSIRIPASCCGVFGLKPQAGRVSIAPQDRRGGRGWHGLSVYGPLTPRVRDAALFLDATAAQRPERPFVQAAVSEPERLRIAVSSKPVPGMTALPRVHPEVRRAVDETARLLEQLGHRVVERSPRYGSVAANISVRYLRGIGDDAASMAHPRRLERRTQRLARLGRTIGDSLLARERAREATHEARIGELFRDHDVLLTPVLAEPPVEVGRWEGRGALRSLLGSAAFAPYTAVWNATGQPAASVPAGVTDGLPIGVQLVGRRSAEATLLSLAAQIERERPWQERLPAPAGPGS